MDLGAALGDYLTGNRSTGDMVESVTIETRFTPPLVISKPLADGPANPLAEFLKPRITVATPYGNTVKAPYGEPDRNYWPEVKLGLTIAAALAARLLIRRLMK